MTTTAATPFHTSRCYACDGEAAGVRDRRPEGGQREAACARHADPSIQRRGIARVSSHRSPDASRKRTRTACETASSLGARARCGRCSRSRTVCSRMRSAACATWSVSSKSTCARTVSSKRCNHSLPHPYLTPGLRRPYHEFKMNTPNATDTARTYRLVESFRECANAGAVHTATTETVTVENGGVRVDSHCVGTVEGTRVDQRSSKFWPGISLDAAHAYRLRNGYTLVACAAKVSP